MSYTEIRSSQPKARKQYRCEWCAEKILIGEKHYYRFYEFNGNKMEGRMHNECSEAYDKEDNENLAEGWIPGDYKRGSCEIK